MSKLAKGQMDIRILEDGTVRTETSDMAGVSHKAADDFLKVLAELLGGEVTDVKLVKGHSHQHDRIDNHHHH